MAGLPDSSVSDVDNECLIGEQILAYQVLRQGLLSSTLGKQYLILNCQLDWIKRQRSVCLCRIELVHLPSYEWGLPMLLTNGG